MTRFLFTNSFDDFFNDYVFRDSTASMLYRIFYICRSSHRRCSVRKGALRNFAKFTGKHLWHRCFVNFAKFLRTPSTEHLRATASVYVKKKSHWKETVFPRCFVKKLFLEISHNSQENTCARVSFLIKLQAWGLQLYLKRDSGTGVFLLIFLWNF